MIRGVAFLLIVGASTGVDLALATAALFFRKGPGRHNRPDVIGLRRVSCAGLAVAASFVARVPLLAPLGVGRFGWVHLAYADLVIVTPLVGLLALASASRRRSGGPARRLTPPARAAAVASLALIPIGVDATWVEPFRLRLERARVEVPATREGKRVVRVGVLTDLQTSRVTDYERGAVDRLMAERPDLILIPGDVFQGTPEQFEATRADLADLLGRLSAPAGVFLVMGDTDRSGAHLLPLLGPAGITVLDDRVLRVTVGDRRVTVGGVALDFQSGRAREVVEALDRPGDEGDIRILLAHRPDVVLGLRPGSRIDLVVAGHTHGGQVVIPGFGPPMTISRVPRRVAAGGLHSIEGNAIYISRGVGCERGQAPRIRFLCPPEVSLLEIDTVPRERGDRP